MHKVTSCSLSIFLIQIFLLYLKLVLCEHCVILLLAVVILGCIMVSIPNRKIKVISYVGQNTMPVFLVHGFVIRWLSVSKIPFDPAQNGVLAPVLAITLIMILVSPPVVNLVKVLTTFHMVRIKDKSLSECD